MVKEGQRQTMGCWRDTYELPLFILSPEAGLFVFFSALDLRVGGIQLLWSPKALRILVK
jgi:hypothetical protein